MEGRKDWRVLKNGGIWKLNWIMDGKKRKNLESMRYWNWSDVEVCAG
jgi:hypothetical protein